MPDPDVDTRPPVTLVSWAFAPDWLTIEEAAYLMGYTIDQVQELIDAGCVDAEETRGRWLVEKRSLREYQDVIFDE